MSRRKILERVVGVPTPPPMRPSILADALDHPEKAVPASQERAPDYGPRHNELLLQTCSKFRCEEPVGIVVVTYRIAQ